MTQNQIRYLELQEARRANQAKEIELNRSNLAKERENYRSNVAKEAETVRSNLASEELTYQKQNYDKYGSGVIPGIARTIKGASEDVTGQEVSRRNNILTSAGSVITILPSFWNQGQTKQNKQAPLYVSGTKPGDYEYERFIKEKENYEKQ